MRQEDQKPYEILRGHDFVERDKCKSLHEQASQQVGLGKAQRKNNCREDKLRHKRYFFNVVCPHLGHFSPPDIARCQDAFSRAIVQRNVVDREVVAMVQACEMVVIRVVQELRPVNGVHDPVPKGHGRKSQNEKAHICAIEPLEHRNVFEWPKRLALQHKIVHECRQVNHRIDLEVDGQT